MNITEFSSKSPYPLVRCERANPYYAQLMLDNMGGQNSEMSAVSLYFYNNLITAQHPELPAIFHKISIVEMHHLEIFGKLALQLGADPRLWTQRGNKMVYWSPEYNKYPTSLSELMQNSLDGELLAIAKYEDQIRNINDKNIEENLKRIIEDEKVHVKIFKLICEEIGGCGTDI